MRKIFIAGNWKMNLTKSEAIALASGLAAKSSSFGNVEVGVIPAFVHIDAVSAAVKGSPISVGAQDVYFEKNGAFTGEISTDMLVDLGVQYALVGHSERRHILKESDELLNKKVLALLARKELGALLCVGELLEERKAEKTFAVIEHQLKTGLAGVDASHVDRLVIAYEPVWAIGTGLTASPQQAQDAHAFTRATLAKMFNPDFANKIQIQYGGSVKASNAGELLSQPDVDGALVGGASLKVDEFVGIITAGAATKK